jgi:excisionase family DNA binding protein
MESEAMTGGNGETASKNEEKAAGGQPSGKAPPPDSLTIRDAALRLGITEKMVRGLIKRGEIESWKIQGKFGKEWRVRLPEGMTRAEDSGAGLHGGRGQALSGAVPADLYYDLLQRHEAMLIKQGQLETRFEASRELIEEVEGLNERALAAESALGAAESALVAAQARMEEDALLLARETLLREQTQELLREVETRLELLIAERNQVVEALEISQAELAAQVDARIQAETVAQELKDRLIASEMALSGLRDTMKLLSGR